MKVFVYGTLQSGHGNNRLLSNCNLLGETTVKNHKLYYAGFPVATPSEGTSIKGEVWEIPEVLEKNTLFNLDCLEGEGMMYHRVTVTTEDNHDCYMYVGVPKFWDDFIGMRECSVVEGVYIWAR